MQPSLVSAPRVRCVGATHGRARRRHAARRTPLQAGAQILFCGRDEALLALDGTLHNAYTLRYLITGVDEPRGWAMRWLTRALRSDVAA